MRSTILLALALVSGACGASPATDRVHPATFKIETGVGSCSAVAVGPHTFLTADHCVVNDGLRRVAVGEVVVDVASIVADDRDHVLIRVDHRFKSWVQVRRSPIRQGEAVFIFGNPGNQTDLYRKGYFAGTEDVILNHPDTKADWPQSGALLFDLNIGRGDSGSGVFDERGLLVSVVSLSYRDNLPLAMGLPFGFSADEWKRARE